IDVGAMRQVEHEGNFHLLCRTSESEVFLTSGVCTHGNAFLNDGLLKGTTVQCPKHNGQFDVQTGKAVQKPATENLTVFNCDIIGGQITTDFSLQTISI
ncbi:MAG: Rieske 2Fe-2S domain-containing protein, partial [Acidimicrobiales bacterium]